MLRLARAAGYNSYDSFRAPFQLALASAGDGLRQRAAKLQAVGGQKRGLRAHDVLAGLQSRAVQSACSLNTPARFDEAVQSMLQARRSEEHTSELQSLMRISYAVFCLKKKKTNN